MLPTTSLELSIGDIVVIEGSYTLRLEASDGELTSVDDVVVTVEVTNVGPIVAAGPDETWVRADQSWGLEASFLQM